MMQCVQNIEFLPDLMNFLPSKLTGSVPCSSPVFLLSLFKCTVAHIFFLFLLIFSVHVNNVCKLKVKLTSY
jgi:hypothetical protein